MSDELKYHRMLGNIQWHIIKRDDGDYLVMYCGRKLYIMHVESTSKSAVLGSVCNDCKVGEQNG